MKRTPLAKLGTSTSAQQKREIQALLREIVIKRDGGCILRNYRYCGAVLGDSKHVLQADHLITRANSATYADSRLVVCLCRTCHGWKHWHKEEYEALVRSILPKQRAELWERALIESWRPTKQDWAIHILALKKDLEMLH